MRGRTTPVQEIHAPSKIGFAFRIIAARTPLKNLSVLKEIEQKLESSSQMLSLRLCLPRLPLPSFVTSSSKSRPEGRLL